MKTTHEFITELNDRFFGGVGLDILAELPEKEQTKYLLDSADRLLGEEGEADAKHFSDLFWSREEGRMPCGDYNPLIDVKSRNEMTDEEQTLCSFLVSLSGLCHDLAFKYPFDPLDIALDDADDQFDTSNELLVKFVTTTRYKNIALGIAKIMKSEALKIVEEVNVPMYKFLRIAGRDTKTIIAALQSIDRHFEKGAAMGLSADKVCQYDMKKGVYEEDL